jgi:4-amino-4-deoxychorismate lyase
MEGRLLLNNRILVNGKSASEIPVMDRGLQYGDGLFETMTVINGEIPFWSYHMQRVKRSCERLLLPIPNEIQLKQEIKQLLTGDADAILKLILTRGLGQRGYRPSTETDMTRILMCFDRPQLPESYWESGVATCVCHTRLATQPLLAGMKHLNRLEQILASKEIDENHYQEGLMCDYSDNIIEATSHNVFAVMAGELLTPELTSCGVEGVLRDYVLDLAQKENIPTRVTNITKSELKLLDEVFLTNSVHGIWPVMRIEDNTYPVGEWTARLRDKIAKILPYN